MRINPFHEGDIVSIDKGDFSQYFIIAVDGQMCWLKKTGTASRRLTDPGVVKYHDDLILVRSAA